jgi:hypothetical protein
MKDTAAKVNNWIPALNVLQILKGGDHGVVMSAE